MNINIPGNLLEVENELQVFFDAMVHKLSRNAHKGTWNQLGIETALWHAIDEMGELTEAVNNYSTTDILLEAADCANFIMMAATIAIRGGASPGRPHLILNATLEDAHHADIPF